MTVENTISKTSKQIMGASTYNFSFDVLLKDPTEEIAKRSVKVAISDGMTETVLTYGKDYTVKLNADRKGGTVTLTDPKNSNYSLVIYRQYDATQGSDYNDFDSFPAEPLEQGLDKLTMLIQELKEQISRTVKVGLISGVDPSVLVQHVERRRSAPAAAAHHRSAHLASESAARIEQSVQKRVDLAAGAAVVHRRAHHDAVDFRQLGDGLVHGVVEHAFSRLAACAACDATGDGLGAHPRELGLDALGFERVSDLAQRGVGAAFLVRAAVDEQYFHGSLPS